MSTFMRIDSHYTVLPSNIFTDREFGFSIPFRNIVMRVNYIGEHHASCIHSE